MRNNNPTSITPTRGDKHIPVSWRIRKLNPNVTIGICVKNNETTIEEAIASVVSQSFPHELMEIIVVDGYSQDKTVSVIKKVLSNEDVATRFFSENKGLSFARQLVVNNARGKYIVWVDGDVVLSKPYVKQQVDLMEKHPEAAIAMGKMGLNPYTNWVALLESISYVVEGRNYNETTTDKLLGTRGSVFRVEALKQIDGFNQKYISHEDSDVAYRLQLAGWKFYVTGAMFFETQRSSWKEIWRRHVWYGYGLHYLHHRHREMNMLTNKTNDRIIISSQAYKLTHRKIVFLLPFNFIFRKIALGYGFLRAHIEDYGHSCS